MLQRGLVGTRLLELRNLLGAFRGELVECKLLRLESDVVPAELALVPRQLSARASDARLGGLVGLALAFAAAASAALRRHSAALRRQCPSLSLKSSSVTSAGSFLDLVAASADRLLSSTDCLYSASRARCCETLSCCAHERNRLSGSARSAAESQAASSPRLHCVELLFDRGKRRRRPAEPRPAPCLELRLEIEPGPLRSLDGA